jgi:hypothetical protein
VKIQTQIRRANCQRRYKVVQQIFHATLTLQRRYRAYKHRLYIIAKWKSLLNANKHICARSIQKIIRGKFARGLFARMKLVRKGKITSAAKIIIRAWVNFKHAKRLQFLLDSHRVEMYTKKYERITKIRAGIQQDRVEIQEDIDYAKSAIQACRVIIAKNEVFIVEVNLRLPRIKVRLCRLHSACRVLNIMIVGGTNRFITGRYRFWLAGSSKARI